MVHNAEKFFTVYEIEHFRSSLKHQLYKCMYSWLELLSGIELSKSVYVASMGIKIEPKSIFFSKYISDDHASGIMGHNKSKHCENVCVCPRNFYGIHEKLNKTDFCCKFCRICHLRRLPAIIIDVI